MFGFLFVYFIGKYFYQLAQEFQKNKWLYTILGIVVYYAGTVLAGLVFGILNVIFDMNIDWENDSLMAILALPFGIASVCLFYYILKNKWKKLVITKDEINDIGINTNEQ